MSGSISIFLKVIVAINIVAMVAASGLLHANPFLNFFCKTDAIITSEKDKSNGLRYEFIIRYCTSILMHIQKLHLYHS